MTNHCQADFGTFKTIISDPLTNNDPTLSVGPPSVAPLAASSSAAFPFLISATHRTRAAKVEKKKAIAVASAQKIGQTAKKNGMVKRKRTPTPLPVPMELIRPGSKRKVRVTSIAAENTPSRRMQRIEAGNKRVDDEIDD